MAHIEGMMEFEFDEKAGQFHPTGKIIGYIRAALAQNDIAGAMQYYGSCNESIGDQLLEEVKTGSSTYKENLAKMFEMVRDYRRAGILFGVLGRPEKAAEFAIAAHDYASAAEGFMKAGMPEKAAACFERDLKFDEAAKLYLQSKSHEKAAACLERAGRLYEAGMLYARLGLQVEAARALQQIPADHPRHVEAMIQVADILHVNDRQEQALRLYHAYLPRVECTRQNVTSFQRLAMAYRDAGHSDWYDRLIKIICSVDPALSPEQHQMKGPAAVKAISAPSATVTVIPEPAAADKMTTLRLGFEHVHAFPLFRGLSMSDVQKFYDLCEKRKVKAGTVLIAEGEAQSTLFILINGKVEVSKFFTEGESNVVARLGPGQSFGEISAFTGALPGATVTTSADSVVFTISRDDLDEFVAEDPGRAIAVYKAIIGILTTRLSAANQQLAGR
ncbi:MAG: cyclic nucleotide-binding domain-containing protein [Myxococcota bacterium]|jgi:tetratricopeptide (TPR) repeat protein